MKHSGLRIATVVLLLVLGATEVARSGPRASGLARLEPQYWIYLPYVSKPQSSTPTATLTPAQTPSPTPTSSVTPVLPIGTTLRFDVFQATIAGADRVDHLDGNSGPVYPRQAFVVSLVDVQNLGFSSDSVSRYDLKVRDSRGRLFDMAELEVQWAAEHQYDLPGVYHDLQPGFAEREVYAFDVALDSTALQLVVATAPVVPIPNPLPSPVVSLNQPGRFNDWQYTVTEILTTRELRGSSASATAKGIFIVVFATVQNLGLTSGYISRFDFWIQDSSTRRFDMADLETQWAAEEQFGRTGVYEDIQPSFTEQQVYVFDILPEDSGLYLVPREPGDAVYLGL